MMAASSALYLKLRRNGMRLGLTRAFTLVEVMVAVVVFCMMALGIYQVMLKAYEFNAVARCTDDGRAVLATFGDQFMRLQSSDYNAAWPDGHGGTVAATYTRWLFQPTSGAATGTGLTAQSATSISTAARSRRQKLYPPQAATCCSEPLPLPIVYMATPAPKASQSCATFHENN
jgi:prepilin-type N-terminal cleavage/methylation domain-containing protein